MGEILSPPLIRAVKQHIKPETTVIIDAPPGTSCPVIAAIKDSDYCILVTEPTPFGLHDLKLAHDVVRKLDMPCGVVINRADLGDNSVVAYCEKEHVSILMSIPFDRDIAVAYSSGTSFVNLKSGYKQLFRQMYGVIKREVHEN